MALEDDQVAQRLVFRRAVWEQVEGLAKTLRDTRGVEVSAADVALIALEAGLAVVSAQETAALELRGMIEGSRIGAEKRERMLALLGKVALTERRRCGEPCPSGPCPGWRGHRGTHGPDASWSPEDRLVAVRQWAEQQVCWADQQADNGSADFATISAVRESANAVLALMRGGR